MKRRNVARLSTAALGVIAAFVLVWGYEVLSQWIREERLIRQLYSQDGNVQMAAAQELAKLRCVRAIPALVDAPRRPEGQAMMEHHENAKALASIGLRSIPVLLGRVASYDGIVRERALRDLQQFSDHRALMTLKDYLVHPNTEVKVAVASMFFSYGRRSDVVSRDLIMTLRDKDPRVRRYAAVALEKVGTEGAEEALAVAMIGDPEVYVRRAAARSLKRRNSQSAATRAALEKSIAKEKNQNVRFEVLKALEQFSDRVSPN